uniref:ETS domain-containing protein n=2 Tax=Mesocestoides corti TaxID=53468 RepID=A0A5K3EYE0_MESCO
MMNFKYPLHFCSGFPKLTSDLNVDPVLTEAISGDESGFLMENAKHEDEGSGMFDLNAQTSPTSYRAPRLSRLAPNDFPESEDLHAAFGSLDNPEDPSQAQHCFIRPVDRQPPRLEEFDEDNGFDSGFGSLQLTPSEINSDSVCESLSPRATPFWRQGRDEYFNVNLPLSEPSPNLPVKEEFYRHSVTPSNQLLELKRYRTLEYASKLCTPPPPQLSKNMQDGLYWGDSYNGRLVLHDCDNGGDVVSPSVPYVGTKDPFVGPFFRANSMSASPPPPPPPARSPSSSPVSHRILNKRVAQREANDFLSSSDAGGHFDERYVDDDDDEDDNDDDYDDRFGLDARYEEGGFASSTRLSHRQGGHRVNQGYSVRRGHSNSLPGANQRRPRGNTAPATVERPRKTCAPRNGGRKHNLLNFILELLTTRQNCVEWVDKPKQVFQIVNPEQLTRLWGEHKNNFKMSFDSLSRSLRLYYKPGKLERIPGTRHQYRLIHRPTDPRELLHDTPFPVNSQGCGSEHRRSTNPGCQMAPYKHSLPQKPFL